MEPPMTDRTNGIVEQQIELWADVKPPNDAARIMAGQLEAVLKGFAGLRGTIRFEDEPSSFEAALQATKDRE